MPNLVLPHPAAGKAGMLIRLSDLPLDRDPLSPDTQRDLNRDAAKRDGAEITKEYVEFVSASKPDVHRPAYEQAIEDLLNREIETLYVAALDRLSRRGAGQVDNLIEELERVGGRIVFVKQGLDSSKPNGRLAIAIYAELARAEAESISWRHVQWHAAARRAGLWVLRRPFGYVVADYKLVPHPDEALIVRRIVEEFLGGASYRSIAKGLNDDRILCPRAVHYYAALDKGHRVKPLPSTKWSFNAVSTLLRNPSLAALMSHDRKLVYDEHGAPVSCGQGIVTMGERVRILAEMERRSTTVQEARDSTRVGKRTGRGRPPKYLLTGFVRCAHCHSALQRMTTRSGGYSSTGYVCSGRKKGTGCSGSQINAETLELEVVTRFTKRLAACEPGDPLLPVIAKRWMAQALPESETDRRRLEDALAVVSQTISDLWDDRYERHMFQTDEDVAEWQRRLDKARKQRDAIREQKDALGPRPEVDIGALLDTELSEEAWKETPLARKRELLGLAVNAVLVLGAKNGQRPARDRIVMVWGHESLPDPLPQDEAPVDARKIIAQLIAEERAGKRPHLTGKEAAEIVGVIQPRWASILLKEQRAKQAAPDSPVE